MTVPVEAETLNMLVISAVDYGLGRRTYLVEETCRVVLQYLPHLTAKTRHVLVRHIRSQERFGYGDPCDEREWRQLLATLEGLTTASD